MLEFSLNESTFKSYLNGFVDVCVGKERGVKLFRWKPYKDMGNNKVVFKKHEFCKEDILSNRIRDYLLDKERKQIKSLKKQILYTK